MSVPNKNSDNLGPILDKEATNPWLIATENYAQCLNEYFGLFTTREQLEEELKRSGINSICKRELNDLRTVMPEISYKEVLPGRLRNDFFWEFEGKDKTQHRK